MTKTFAILSLNQITSSDGWDKSIISVIFLVACMQLYKPLSRSVRWLVGPYVHWSVCPLVRMSVCPSVCRLVRWSVCWSVADCCCLPWEAPWVTDFPYGWCATLAGWRGRTNQKDCTFGGSKGAVPLFTYKKDGWAKSDCLGGTFNCFGALRGANGVTDESCATKGG